MAWSIVADRVLVTTASTSQSGAFGTNPTTGNTLVVALIAGGAGATTFSSPADTYGNTWTDLGQYRDASRASGLGCYACVNHGGSGTNTFTCTTSISTQVDICLFEFAGGAATIQQDGTVQTADATASPITVPSFTATSGSLLINATFPAGTITAFGTPWAAIATNGGLVSTRGNGTSFVLNASGSVSPNCTENGSVTHDPSAVWGLKAVTVDNTSKPACPGMFTPSLNPLGWF